MRFASFASQTRYCAIVLAGFALSVPFGRVRASEPASFVIPGGNDDGYGISECLQAGSACGRVIADAWCESHGHAGAVAFGVAADVTGSISDTDQVRKVSADDVLIRCGD